ncbi:flavodoxin family protein [Dehalobacter restrictus]|jgi:multimeric flavodoxin WrbA|uniref:NADPH-dependent FMN reductase n=1 Tax=Dehalobacter restrictus (strain DSM 9455 / PER-K23) TaxID=871738 RepID=A0ABN4BSN2_DEHRP|nr:flavodoxin family protein [Dehalobacter restrictus]AHF10468.1 NADPH-dependent FMN reductase [Dehalobacter restrictus DSM 9455]
MKVLGISGSPRKGGNTETLLDEALAGAHEAGAETEKIILSTCRYQSCLSCGACEKAGICIQKDDMQGIYGKIALADVMIFASPMYFYTVSGWAKSAIDRSQALWSRKYILKEPSFAVNKKAYFIGVGATKGERLFEGAKLVMKYFYDATGYEAAGELLIKSIDKKGDIRNYPEYLKAARSLGEKAAEGARHSLAGF